MIDEIITVARDAGKILMKYYQKDFDVEYKEDKSEVTIADKEADAFIREKLSELFPDDQILTEESEHTVANFSGDVWIVDPLDGTGAFVMGKPYFSVNIALCKNGAPTLGVIYVPVDDRLYFAEAGKGGFVEKNGERIKLNVSSTKLVRESRFINRMKGKEVRVFDHIVEGINVKEHVRIGSFGILDIAEGDADFFIWSSRSFGKWDSCAMQVILEEAGGRVTDLYGKELDYFQKDVCWQDSVVFSNGVLHDSVLEEIRKLL